MICKWCGETLKTGSKTCKRCKRDVPAKSDCGGFYDLVSLPGTQPPAAPIPAAPTPVMPEPVLRDAAAPRRNRGTLNPKILFGGAVALIVILLVMVISLSGKLAEARDDLNRLKDDRSDKKNTETTEATGNLNGFDSIDPTDDPNKPAEDETPDSMEKVTIENGAATFAFGVEHCSALDHEPVYVEVVDSNQQRVAVISLTLNKTENSRELIVDVEELAEDCEIKSVTYAEAENKLNSDTKKPGEPYLLKDGENANITCCLTGFFEDESQITIEITNIVIH